MIRHIAHVKKCLTQHRSDSIISEVFSVDRDGCEVDGLVIVQRCEHWRHQATSCEGYLGFIINTKTNVLSHKHQNSMVNSMSSLKKLKVRQIKTKFSSLEKTLVLYYLSTLECSKV